MQTTEDAVEQTSEHGGALAELYARHALAGRRLVYFLTGDRDLAEDLVQDAFVDLAGRFRHRRQPDAFDAYLRRTIVNLFTSYLRRLRVERRELVRRRADIQEVAGDDDQAERDALWLALQTLPPRQRAAIVLRYCEDLSERQTADVLRCSVGASKQLIVELGLGEDPTRRPPNGNRRTRSGPGRCSEAAGTTPGT